MDHDHVALLGLKGRSQGQPLTSNPNPNQPLTQTTTQTVTPTLTQLVWPRSSIKDSSLVFVIRGVAMSKKWGAEISEVNWADEWEGFAPLH